MTNIVQKQYQVNENSFHKGLRGQTPKVYPNMSREVFECKENAK